MSSSSRATGWRSSAMTGLMPISCHFQDYKALLFEFESTHVSSAHSICPIFHSWRLNCNLRFFCSHDRESCPVPPCHTPPIPMRRWNDVMTMGHGSRGSWVNCVMGHMGHERWPISIPALAYGSPLFGRTCCTCLAKNRLCLFPYSFVCRWILLLRRNLWSKHVRFHVSCKLNLVTYLRPNLYPAAQNLHKSRFSTTFWSSRSATQSLKPGRRHARSVSTFEMSRRI